MSQLKSLEVKSMEAASLGVSGTSSVSSTSQVLDGYAARSWRFLAELQRSSGMEFVIGEAQGSYLWNVERTHRLLDCGNSGGVHSLGHRNRELLATMRTALDHYDAGIWTMPTAEALSLHDAFVSFAPVASICKSVVTLSSTDSIDLAVMFAFRFTGRKKILAYRHGYHGHGGYAALVTGSEPEGVLDHYSLPRSQSRFFLEYDSIESIRAAIDEDCAAVILEPVNYETFKPASVSFLQDLAALCKESGTLLIIDETRTGLSRSGSPWMISRYGVAPDMLILGKGLGGGLYPVSAVLTTAAIYERCMNDGHWGFMSSMAGSPIGSLIASKVIEIIQRKELLDNIARLEQALSREFDLLNERFPSVFAPGWVLGGIAAIGLREESAAREIRPALFRHGVMCHSVSEIEPRVVKFFPCLTSSVQEVDEIAGALHAFATGVLRGGLSAKGKMV
jgi:putrescine aminotransferase